VTPDHAISSAVTAAKLPLCSVILKRRLRRTTTKWRKRLLLFFRNSSTFEVWTFWLSYCKYSIFM